MFENRKEGAGKSSKFVKSSFFFCILLIERILYLVESKIKTNFSRFLLISSALKSYIFLLSESF